MHFSPNSTRKLILVTGAARSGKSEWAESLAEQSQKSVIYIATALIEPDDLEWQARIKQHQSRRPADWQMLAVPIDLATTICSGAATDCLLIDSLGTWLANILEQDEAMWVDTIQGLLIALSETASDVILVAEEVGWGVVPAYPIGRLFRDRLGNLVRQIGAIANSVYLVTGGYALDVSQLGTPLSTIHANKP
jgi:adenosylcobinamide kinase/adenosylcobinamide-phosphate guanylyltransferase